MKVIVKHGGADETWMPVTRKRHGRRDRSSGSNSRSSEVRVKLRKGLLLISEVHFENTDEVRYQVVKEVPGAFTFMEGI